MLKGAKEVSCRAYPPVFELIAKSGYSVDEVFRGVSVPLSYLRDTSKFTRWEVLNEVMERCSSLVAGSETQLIAWGMSGPQTPGNRWFQNIVTAFADVKLIYRLITRLFMSRTFPAMQCHYEDLGHDHVRITLIPPKSTPRAFFLIWLGAFQATPRVFKQPYALIEDEISPTRAVYTIQCPPSLTLLSRLRNAWRVLFSARSMLEELAAQADEIRHNYHQQMEQELKIKLSFQMSHLTRMSALGEMAGGIAHEVNNPLAVVTAHASRLRRMFESGQVDLEKANASIASIERMTERMAKIIRGLRAFARNAEHDPMEDVPVSKIFDDTLQLCREKLNKLQIKVIGAPTNERDIGFDPVIHCRSTELSQVLMNIFSNAMDALESVPIQERRIRIVVSHLGPEIEIAISDSGPIIPSEIEQKLFQPFFTTKEVGKGTGLGLSISKGIIESHGGHIFYDHFSPEGKRFVIRLPASPSVAKELRV